jgi:hypothetical protein
LAEGEGESEGVFNVLRVRVARVRETNVSQTKNRYRAVYRLIIIIYQSFRAYMKHLIAVVHVMVDLLGYVVPRGKVESAYLTAFESAGA